VPASEDVAACQAASAQVRESAPQGRPGSLSQRPCESGRLRRADQLSEITALILIEPRDG